MSREPDFSPSDLRRIGILFAQEANTTKEHIAGQLGVLVMDDDCRKPATWEAWLRRIREAGKVRELAEAVGIESNFPACPACGAACEEAQDGYPDPIGPNGECEWHPALRFFACGRAQWEDRDGWKEYGMAEDATCKGSESPLCGHGRPITSDMFKCFDCVESLIDDLQTDRAALRAALQEAIVYAPHDQTGNDYEPENPTRCLPTCRACAAERLANGE